MKINAVLFLSISILFLSFTFLKEKKFKTPKGFVFVPSGTTDIDEKKVSCNAFYMSDHEVTNFEYGQFISYLKSNNMKEQLAVAQPDTTVWKQLDGAHMNPMITHYYSHPAYGNYPVVGISIEGAKLYSNYVTEQFRMLYGEQINDFRLPTKEEWIYAAKGGLEQSPYPWGGPYMRDSKGDYLANFKPIGDQNISTDPDGGYVVKKEGAKLFSDGAFITAPVDSYWPNGYGLYNMSGNVAELVEDNTAMGGDWNSCGYDVRVNSELPFENPNPFTGFRVVMSHLLLRI